MTTTNDSVTNAAETTSVAQKITGRVKWFNNKAGYGFITVTDGEKSGSDIFVHHSAILVSSQQYKYLVQGEYVEFNLVTTQNSTHEVQASDVSGIKGGKLMCETRQEFKASRSNYKKSNEEVGDVQETAEPVKMPRQKRVVRSEGNEQKTTAPRVRGKGPRGSDENGDWKVVGNEQKRSTTSSGRGRGRPPRQQTSQS